MKRLSVEDEVEKLEGEFLAMESSFFKTMHTRNVTPNELRGWILVLPSKLKKSFAQLLRSDAASLSDAKTIDELYPILSPYWNTLHPALLEHVINMLEDEELVCQKEQYLKKLQDFRCRTTVGDFMDQWVSEIPQDYYEITLEMKDNWREKTLEDLERFRNQMNRLQCLEGHMVERVKSSSILLVLGVPEHLFPLNVRDKDLCHLLREEGVLRVMVDGECVLDIENLVSCVV